MLVAGWGLTGQRLIAARGKTGRASEVVAEKARGQELVSRTCFRQSRRVGEVAVQLWSWPLAIVGKERAIRGGVIVRYWSKKWQEIVRGVSDDHSLSDFSLDKARFSRRSGVSPALLHSCHAPRAAVRGKASHCIIGIPISETIRYPTSRK